MKLFYHYLKSHLGTVLLYLASQMAILFLCRLYFVPLNDIIYFHVIFSFITLAVSLIFFFRFRQKHLQLSASLHHLEAINWTDEPATSLLEEDYQTILLALTQANQALLTKKNRDYQELLDYYTLWVHQIKTPISSLGLLLQVNPNSQMELELIQIEQYADMALEYVRIDGISSDLVLEYYPVEEIVNQVIKKLSILFIYQKIKLNLHPFELNALTDKQWLSFVIEQIISNALKYTSKGSISIYLLSPQTLVIEDTGIGIQAEDITRIFEKNFTGYNGRKDQKSSGLGLYMSQKILTKLDHRISITSQVNQGTKVYIDLSHENLTIL